MSHTTTIGTVAIRDLQALQQAVNELKATGVDCTLVQNAKPRMYYTHQEVQCDWVLKIPTAKYDVGFEKQKDGSYVPFTDLYGGSVGQTIGASCPMPNSPDGKAQHAIGKLMQNYTKNATVNQARRQGMTVERATVDDAGNVKLVLAS